MESQAQDGTIDIDELTRKYAEERDKRMRPESGRRYRSLTGELADFDVDPNAQPAFRRAPVERDTDVLVIGGGFGGLLTAIQLRKHGIDDLVIAEKGADFGGTWYWNRYPGIRCDVDAYIYLPMLEETGYIPTEKYAKGEEIHKQCRLLADKFGLYDRALFQTRITTLVWNEERQRWTVGSDRGDVIQARFVVASTGLFSSPKLPDIPGIETFRGPSFHTSRWNYDFTGGNADGNLTGLVGKTVGIIGTGSTGIQCVPPVADHAEHLYIFQRTPCSVDVRGNRPTDVAWFTMQAPGWQRKRIENFTQWTSGVLQDEDLVQDSMTDLFRKTDEEKSTDMSAEQRSRAELLKMEKVRQRIDTVVAHRETAEALKPYYHYFCKRPGFSDDYLQAFNRPNVTLVDTAGRSVERVTPDGLIVDGKEYALDCIIYATGFEYMRNYTRESGLDITGRGGLSLDSHWKYGARTLFGMQTHGFPNFFILSVVQAGISLNYLHTADAQSIYAANLVHHCLTENYGTVQPTAKAEQEWVDLCVESSLARREFHKQCTPSYLNFEGNRPQEAELNAPFGGGPLPYFTYLDAMSRERFAHRVEFDARTTG